MFSLYFPVPFPFAGNLFPQWVSHLIGSWTSFFSIPFGAESGRAADKQLVQEALSGDPGFEKLVRAYETLVYRVAFRFLGNPTDASDVAQEVFLRVHRSLPKFRGDSSLSTWIYAITANLSRNAIRSKRNREKVQVLAPQEEEGTRSGFWDRVVDDRGTLQTRGLESRELNGAIQEALLQLPTDFREAVILRDLEGLDYEEIAKLLKTGLGTVKSRISRGRALLQDKLREWL